MFFLSNKRQEIIDISAFHTARVTQTALLFCQPFEWIKNRSLIVFHPCSSDNTLQMTVARYSNETMLQSDYSFFSLVSHTHTSVEYSTFRIEYRLCYGKPLFTSHTEHEAKWQSMCEIITAFRMHMELHVVNIRAIEHANHTFDVQLHNGSARRTNTLCWYLCIELYSWCSY